eukprot:737325_1
MANLVFVSLIYIVAKQAQSASIYWSSFWDNEWAREGWSTRGWAGLRDSWIECTHCIYVGWGDCSFSNDCTYPGYGTAKKTFDITGYTNIQIEMYYKVNIALPFFDKFRVLYRYGPSYGSWKTAFTTTSDNSLSTSTLSLAKPECDQTKLQIWFSTTTTCAHHSCWSWDSHYSVFIEELSILGDATPSLVTCPPTRSPSAAPTIPPTDSTIAPTMAPVFSPTSAPSLHPTFSPTTAPSFSPTLVPTSHPTYPTSPPTANPTQLPTIPTMQPTMAERTYCGADRNGAGRIAKWCYYLDLFPSPGITTSQTINIQNALQGQHYFEIYITIKDSHCIEPTIAFTFQDIKATLR